MFSTPETSGHALDKNREISPLGLISRKRNKEEAVVLASDFLKSQTHQISLLHATKFALMYSIESQIIVCGTVGQNECIMIFMDYLVS